MKVIVQKVYHISGQKRSPALWADCKVAQEQGNKVTGEQESRGGSVDNWLVKVAVKQIQTKSRLVFRRNQALVSDRIKPWIQKKQLYFQVKVSLVFKKSNVTFLKK
jgi:hypothetical protein